MNLMSSDSCDIFFGYFWFGFENVFGCNDEENLFRYVFLGVYKNGGIHRNNVWKESF